MYLHIPRSHIPSPFYIFVNYSEDKVLLIKTIYALETEIISHNMLKLSQVFHLIGDAMSP